MKNNIPYRYKWLLRHVATALLFLGPFGLVSDVISKLVFAPRRVSWQAEAIEILMTVLWIAVVWLFSMLLPPNAARYEVNPRVNSWKGKAGGQDDF